MIYLFYILFYIKVHYPQIPLKNTILRYLSHFDVIGCILLGSFATLAIFFATTTFHYRFLEQFTMIIIMIILIIWQLSLPPPSSRIYPHHFHHNLQQTLNITLVNIIII